MTGMDRTELQGDEESKGQSAIFFLVVRHPAPRPFAVRGSRHDPHRTRRTRRMLTLLYSPQISVHSADVKNVLRVYSIEVAAREKDDLNEDPIVVRLRKVGSSKACVRNEKMTQITLFS